MEGTYTSPARVERDGFLVAFEGETMTMAEAAKRGLVEARGKQEAKGKKLKADWIAEAEELGLEVPDGATVEQIKALVEEASEGDGDGEE